MEYNATHDYNDEVARLPKKCFVNRIPEDGFYFFREAGKGTWSITSDIKVVKKISEKEREKILSDFGYNEAAAYSKYKAAFEKRMRLA